MSVWETPPSKDVLSRHLPALSLGRVTVARAFWEATNHARVPGGIVSIRGRPEEHKASFTIPADATLREALDRIPSESPSLEWKMNGGVVDLLPPRALPEILNVQIASYDFEDANNGSLAIQELLARPEVEQKARSLGFQPALNEGGMTVYYGAGMKPPPSLPVHLRNVTLLEAVDALMRARGAGLWRYDEGVSNSKSWFRITLGVGPPE
jgi:hypothetical protein